MTSPDSQPTASPRDVIRPGPAPAVGMADRRPGATGMAVGQRPRRQVRHPDARTGRLKRASDTELADALCAHDTAALDEVFDRHATQVALTVRKVAGGYYIDDVVQDVFMALWRAPERFHPERGSLATYLAVSARGRTLDRVRSDGAWHRRHREHGFEPALGGEVADAVMASVTAAELQIALRSVPMNERVAIELAFFGGDSYRQVAAKLGVPEGTIKGRIRAGLRRLEVVLREIGAQEVD
ncbi:MAG: sigma-70 family RNA polymerase sigma factor [Actinomycetota bacterium]|nr:sigma-70 family RNA polymerase sigma factor [Actinomycetota bacterium]